MNRRLVVIALALLSIGVPAVQIVSRMEDRGVDPVVAVEAVRRARTAAERTADPGQPDLYKHRLAMFTRSTNQAQANALVADALCHDVADAGEGFTDDAAACRAAEGLTFGAGRVCNGFDALRGYYAEGQFRDRDRLALLAAEASVVDAGTIVLEVAPPAVIKGRLADRGFKRCPEAP